MTQCFLFLLFHLFFHFDLIFEESVVFKDQFYCVVLMMVKTCTAQIWLHAATAGSLHLK